MTICNVTLKGRRRLVFADLCLNRDDFRTVLQQKVDLSCFVRVIARLHLKLPAKLLQDIVLGQRPFQRPFELIVRFQQDGAVVDTRHVLEQPCIKQEQLAYRPKRAIQSLPQNPVPGPLPDSAIDKVLGAPSHKVNRLIQGCIRAIPAATLNELCPILTSNGSITVAIDYSSVR